MLKIWKRTWKERDPVHMSFSGQNSDQEGALDGLGNSTSSPDVAKAAPSSEATLHPMLPPGYSDPKRSRRRLELETSPDDRPLKKTRMDTSLAFHNTLGNHLPEVGGAWGVESPISTPMAVLTDQVLEQAKRENTIVVFPPLKSAIGVLVQFLIWAIEIERGRPKSTIIRHRTALVVVDDESSVGKYGAQIEAEMPGITVREYSGSIQKSEADPWTNSLEQDVVVVPSTLLLDSLIRGVLAITQIHALVIADAQNIRDQDSQPLLPIVQVMNDFYSVTDFLSRPRILALVLPPPDCGFHLDSGLLELETTLDSKVFGVPSEKRAEVPALPARPSELVVLYDTQMRLDTTPLLKRLHQFDSTEAIFRKHFRASRHALAEVGPCASDLIWRRALKEIDANIVPRYDDDDDDDESGKSVSAVNLRRRMRDTVKNWAFTMPNLDPGSRGFNVTYKFLRLVEVLKSCESYGESFRGIVFVQQRAIALVIVDLLRTLDEQLGFLRPCAVIGYGSFEISQHQEIFQNFASGAYNLLIATKSVEDLDVPKASTVIRFDVFESQVSHAYAHACTRGRESHLVHMAERNNEVHHRIISQITQPDPDTLHWTEILCNTPQSSVPHSTLREITNPYHSDIDDDDDKGVFISDPTTNGRICIQDATTVMYRFASSAIDKGEGINPEHALFKFRDEQNEFGLPHKYTCSVILPGTLAHGVSGSSSASMAHARRIACYNACEGLAKAGLLDYRLFPLPQRATAHDDPITLEDFSSQGHTDNKLSGTRCYPRKQPHFWANTRLTPIKLLYPTIVSTDNFGEAVPPHSPILILTRQPLPDLASFQLFFPGVSASVNFQRGAAFQVDDARLQDLYLYTVRICRAVSNKPYVCPLANMAYFFAPLKFGWASSANRCHNSRTPPDVVGDIPWDLVSLAAGDYAVALKRSTLEEAEKDIQDAVIQDRWVEFTRRYDAVRMRPDLTPLSKPLDSPREAGYDSFVDFCKARRKGFEGLQDYDQAIIEVSKVPALMNHLNPTSRPLPTSAKPPAKYLIPELCAKFTIPASTLRTALLLPSVTRRIDDFLLVKELNAKFFDHDVSEKLLHMAICAPSSGVEYDYERLELLGDAFLKYLSTIYVFVANPASNEGALHVARQGIISNKSLLQNATRTGLPAYIQSKPFASRLWHPPNFQLLRLPRPPNQDFVTSMGSTQDLDVLSESSPGPESSRSNDISLKPPVERRKFKKRNKKRKQQDDTQWLGDKAVADVAEAIIGAAYISGGRETALKITKALRVPILNIDRWSDFGRKILTPPPTITAKLKPGSIEAVEAIIGHKFARPHLLAQALTHASIQGFELTSYERLEFIGDAILDFMVIRHIFDRDQQLSPGGLTLLKSAMVSNSALAAVCVWFGLHEYLHYDSYALASSIREYVAQLKTKQAEEYNVAAREGRSPGQYWLDLEPPKALSDVMESITGAIYISDDFSPVGAEALFDNLLKPFFDRHVTLKTLSHHPTKILFELFQAQGCQKFKILKEKDEQNGTRCHVLVHDVILSSAEDATSTAAARRASLFALDALEGDLSFLTRTCDCRTNSQTKSQKKALENVLADSEEEQQDILAVEDVLAQSINMRSQHFEKTESEGGIIFE